MPATPTGSKHGAAANAVTVHKRALTALGRKRRAHPFLPQCPFNKDIMQGTASDVRDMITAEATANTNSVHRLPLWFCDHAPLHLTTFEPFRKLNTYNKHMGGIPGIHSQGPQEKP